MDCSFSQIRPRRSRLRLSKSLKDLLLSASVETDFHEDSSANPIKRQLEEIDESPAKRVRLTKTQQPEVAGGRVQPSVEVREHMLLPSQSLMPWVKQRPVLQHPKPKLPYASFLETFVDPFQPDPHAASKHSFVLEWLESLGSVRDTYSRSDSYLLPADESPIPRRFARSAPAIGSRLNTDGYLVPTTLDWTGDRSRADMESESKTGTGTGSSGSSGKGLVSNPIYREVNLAANDIYFRDRDEPVPQIITDIVQLIRRDRDSPGPSPEDVRHDVALGTLLKGTPENQVEKYFHINIFPEPEPRGKLKRLDKSPMAKHTMPNTESGPKLSTPVPDILYGYNRMFAFSGLHKQLITMGTEVNANNQFESMLYPFLVVEFKGDGGSMWVAENQCLGASAACVNMADSLNRRLRQCKSTFLPPIDNAAFSIAMNGYEARIHISWKENELDTYMVTTDVFHLHDPEHYIKFRKYVRNIIDWGRGARLEAIRKSLDSLWEDQEERREAASAAAKARKPPSSADSAAKKRKTSRRPKSGGSSSTEE
ncbi:hypothetical protein IL306_003293 [Fusarium sp. DS 682]|nr:hypothetical protein IL306_003293 [Fusarium sp. DS 682]